MALATRLYAALGAVTFVGAALVMYGFQTIWFNEWWSTTGLLASIMLPPVVAAFPFIYVAKEGFDALYFGAWMVGLVAMLLYGIAEYRASN